MKEKKTNNSTITILIDFTKWIWDKLKSTGVKIGVGIIIVLFLGLGVSIGWQCGTDGVNCSGGYTPPKAEDIKKLK